MNANFKPRVALSRMAAGQGGRVCAPQNGTSIPARLLDLGFVPGTRLKIRRRAPLGDPVEIEIRGYRLCLRTDQLETIFVELEGGIS